MTIALQRGSPRDCPHIFLWTRALREPRIASTVAKYHRRRMYDPAHYLARIKIYQERQRDPALVHANSGDVRHPDIVRAAHCLRSLGGQPACACPRSAPDVTSDSECTDHPASCSCQRGFEERHSTGWPFLGGGGRAHVYFIA